MKSNIEELKSNLLQHIRKLSVYLDYWDNDNSLENEKEESKSIIEYSYLDFLEILEDYGYIKKIEIDGWFLFIEGGNKKDKFLSDYAKVFTIENGLITLQQNDYFEVVRQLKEIRKEFVKDSKYLHLFSNSELIEILNRNNSIIEMVKDSFRDWKECDSVFEWNGNITTELLNKYFIYEVRNGIYKKTKINTNGNTQILVFDGY